MVRQCQVCRVTAHITGTGVSFHKFPNDPVRRRKWFEVFGFKHDKLLPQRALVCDRHFSSENFIFKENGVKYLKNGADPKSPHVEREKSQEVTCRSNIDVLDQGMVRDIGSMSGPSEIGNMKIDMETFNKIPAAGTIPYEGFFSENDLSSFSDSSSTDTASETRDLSPSLQVISAGQSPQREVETTEIKSEASIPANPEKRNIWFALLGFEKDKLLPKRPYICSDHFVKGDFQYKDNGLKYLKSNAAPQPVHTQVFQLSSGSDIGSDLGLIELPTTPTQSRDSNDLGNGTITVKSCDSSRVSDSSGSDIGSDLGLIELPTTPTQSRDSNDLGNGTITVKSCNSSRISDSVSDEQLVEMLESESPLLTPELLLCRGYRTRKKRYFGDISLDDFETLEEKKYHISTEKRIYQERKKIKGLNNRTRKIEAKLAKIECLVNEVAKVYDVSHIKKVLNDEDEDLSGNGISDNEDNAHGEELRNVSPVNKYYQEDYVESETEINCFDAANQAQVIFLAGSDTGNEEKLKNELQEVAKNDILKSKTIQKLNNSVFKKNKTIEELKSELDKLKKAV